MARRKQKNSQSIVSTVTGKITVAPKRIKYQTGKVMAVATMQAQVISAVIIRCVSWALMRWRCR
ncbi:hypothetical protein [Xenorhabdus sp. PB62.4]|uniref:hypothetical protein n=1 Tax=Xenorhabdus sp. PB62.4 TaxID=1851573 RepID=UPI00210752F8|nr:hypothetical protein [Xenorhabdus sp. PB62.4]